jgi:hypothetical protein
MVRLLLLLMVVVVRLLFIDDDVILLLPDVGIKGGLPFDNDIVVRLLSFILLLIIFSTTSVVVDDVVPFDENIPLFDGVVVDMVVCIKSRPRCIDAAATAALVGIVIVDGGVDMILLDDFLPLAILERLPLLVLLLVVNGVVGGPWPLLIFLTSVFVVTIGVVMVEVMIGSIELHVVLDLVDNNGIVVSSTLSGIVGA